jgi:hypothetical protein
MKTHSSQVPVLTVCCSKTVILMNSSVFNQNFGATCYFRDILYPQNLSLTSSTSGGCSVSKVCSCTGATEFSLVLMLLPRLGSKSNPNRKATVKFTVCSMLISCLQIEAVYSSEMLVDVHHNI